MLLHTFAQQEAAALSKKTCEDVEVDGNIQGFSKNIPAGDDWFLTFLWT